uniref:Global nitrogen transcriptional regulator n=1 Tax=Nemalion vermiculare TaxID=935621 RepID=UPI00257DBA2E|nr:Global nitrogen transcriptional regulator [Nemalion vermiculare]WGV34382.1 Global nitrogen transcriptional regulator [Nemalion vermiculare]
MNKRLTEIPSIYKLEQGDRIVIHKHDDNNIYLVIEGVLLVYKTFTNGTSICLSIIHRGKIINPLFQKHDKHIYFYSIESISVAYILSLKNNNTKLLNTLQVKSGRVLLYQQNLLEVSIHKNVKQKLIHLFLMLCEILGEYRDNYMIVCLSLSYITIARIVGSNRNTISKIIFQLEEQKLMLYTKKYFIVYDMVQLSKRNV